MANGQEETTSLEPSFHVRCDTDDDTRRGFVSHGGKQNRKCQLQLREELDRLWCTLERLCGDEGHSTTNDLEHVRTKFVSDGRTRNTTRENRFDGRSLVVSSSHNMTCHHIVAMPVGPQRDEASAAKVPCET